MFSLTMYWTALIEIIKLIFRILFNITTPCNLKLPIKFINTWRSQWFLYSLLFLINHGKCWLESAYIVFEISFILYWISFNIFYTAASFIYHWIALSIAASFESHSFHFYMKLLWEELVKLKYYAMFMFLLTLNIEFYSISLILLFSKWIPLNIENLNILWGLNYIQYHWFLCFPMYYWWYLGLKFNVLNAFMSHWTEIIWIIPLWI